MPSLIRVYQIGFLVVLVVLVATLIYLRTRCKEHPREKLQRLGQRPLESAAALLLVE